MNLSKVFVLFGTLTGNKLDQILNSDFTEQEIREFEEQWQVPVLRIANVTGRRLADGRSLDGKAGVVVSDHYENTGKSGRLGVVVAYKVI